MTVKELTEYKTSYIITNAPEKMTLRFPAYEFVHPNIIQAKLNEGWILDGNVYTDHETYETVIKLRKL